MSLNKHLSFVMRCLRLNLAAFALIALCHAFFSFKTSKFNDDVLTLIGLSPAQANEKISNSIIGGFMETWGIKNLKNIATANKAGVASDLLNYTKTFVQSAEFEKKYATMREDRRPQPAPAPQTPEQYKTQLIDQAQQVVKDAQKYYDGASAENKASFKSSLDESKKYLEDVQKPDNEMLKYYADSYQTMVDMYKKDSADKAAEWQEEYPGNANLFVKKRLQEFMDATSDINFNATTVERNGKTYFADQQYERKSNRWKMAYRAGKEVVETSRTFVVQWIKEIK